MFMQVHLLLVFKRSIPKIHIRHLRLFIQDREKLIPVAYQEASECWREITHLIKYLGYKAVVHDFSSTFLACHIVDMSTGCSYFVGRSSSYNNVYVRSIACGERSVNPNSKTRRADW